jgi:hypothetical protein
MLPNEITLQNVIVQSKIHSDEATRNFSASATFSSHQHHLLLVAYPWICDTNSINTSSQSLSNITFFWLQS